MSRPFQPDLDTVSTIGQDGSRRILHPADVKGRFTSWRRVVACILIAVYVALPWIPIGSYPAVFLDIVNLRFHLFGLTFATQDLWLAFFFVTGLAFALFYVSALFGRIWCGWACPYTVFLEQMFRRVERWIEGDAPHRKRLAAAPWTFTKVRKSVLKHGIYLLLAALIAHVFLSYFVSLPHLWEMMHEAPTTHWTAFAVVSFLTVSIYFCFAWFREQFCIILCPYGRIQSVLTDDHTVVIGYDTARGEPRGKLNAKGAGDCINCLRCVQVCPTGIDIRNGLQIECVGCANCIDACDQVMDKISRPRGLVRYDSMQGFQGKVTRWLRPRMLVYSLLMAIGFSVFAFSVSGIQPAHTQISRLQGSPFFVTGQSVRNQFQLRILSKSQDDLELDLSIKGLPETAFFSGVNGDKKIALAPYEESVFTFFVEQSLSAWQGPSDFQLIIGSTEGQFHRIYELTFLGPNPWQLSP